MPERVKPTSRRTLTLVGGLYVTQYLGIGFFTVGLVGILRDGGVPLATLGLIQLIGIIWPLKLLWSPLVDRFGMRRRGHYRSWLLVCQSGLVLSLLTLIAFHDPVRQLTPILALCTVYVLCSATQDIAADAIAVRLLTGRLRGLGNGIQVASTYVGSLVGGGLCIVVYDRFGWAAAIGLLVTMTLVGLGLVIGYREPARRPVPRPLADGYAALWTVLAQPGCRRWALGAVPLLYSGSAGVYALVTPALVDAGWSLTRIGTVTAIVASGPAIVAGIGAGGLIARWGRAPVLLIGTIVILFGSAGVLVLLLGGAPTLATVVALCVFMVGYTITNVVVYTVTMDFSRATSAGTDFTVLTSIALAVSFLASSAGLVLAGLVGYGATVAVAAVLVVLGAALGLRVLKDRAVFQKERLAVHAAP